MNKILERSSRCLLAVSAVCFFLIFIVNIANMFARSFLGFSLVWAMDFSMFMAVWSICLAMACGVYKNEHLVVTFFVDIIPVKKKAFFGILMHIVFLVVCLLLLYQGVVVTRLRMGLLYVILRWPQGYAYAALPVFAFFSSLYLINKIVIDVKNISAGGAVVK
jgi:TRAP-type C4-dicarboxylate transport system permease small subunit